MRNKESVFSVLLSGTTVITEREIETDRERWRDREGERDIGTDRERERETQRKRERETEPGIAGAARLQICLHLGSF